MTNRTTKLGGRSSRSPSTRPNHAGSGTKRKMPGIDDSVQSGKKMRTSAALRSGNNAMRCLRSMTFAEKPQPARRSSKLCKPKRSVSTKNTVQSKGPDSPDHARVTRRERKRKAVEIEDSVQSGRKKVCDGTVGHSGHNANRCLRSVTFAETLLPARCNSKLRKNKTSGYTHSNGTDSSN